MKKRILAAAGAVLALALLLAGCGSSNATADSVRGAGYDSFYDLKNESYATDEKNMSGTVMPYPEPSEEEGSGTAALPSDRKLTKRRKWNWKAGNMPRRWQLWSK